MEYCRACAGLIAGSSLPAAAALCSSCFAELACLSPLLEPCPMPCGLSLPVASALQYQGMIRELVFKFKYGGDCLLADDLASLLDGAFNLLENSVADRQPVLVPVPLHWSRLLKRGFNQAELLSLRLAARRQLTCLPQALRRRKATKAHHDLGRSERFANTASAFEGCKRLLAGRSVVLVDDIYTSGATLSEAGNTVLKAGARQVLAVTLARAIL